MKDLSIIIPYKYVNPVRDKTFQYIHEYYQEKYPKSEICIGEDTTTTKQFNCSNAINNGVKQSNGKYVFIVGADTFVPKEYVQKSVKQLKHSPFIIPFGYIYSLDPYISQRIVSHEDLSLNEIEKHGQKISIIPGDTHYTPKNSGVQVMEKTFFNQMNGYDERFVGWGFEDTYFCWRVIKEVGDYPLLREGKIYHLWHHRNNMKNNREYQRNKKLFHRLGGDLEDFYKSSNI